METKYTSDGKKVVVVGKLNSTDTIVQEVFIINGSEIPSGEHFIVKTLHDAPAISWKDNEIRNLEKRYNKEVSLWEYQIKTLNKTMSDKEKELTAKLKYAGNVIKNISPESFNTICNFLINKIKYIVVCEYEPKLIKWDDFKKTYEDKLRLLSIFGNDDGTLTYRIGEYYDYSGHTTKFVPFLNHKDALKFFTDYLNKQEISDVILNTAKKYGIKLNQEKVKEFKKERINSLNNQIAGYTDRTLKAKMEIQEMEEEN